MANSRSTSIPSPAATRASSTAARNCAPKRVRTRNSCSAAAIDAADDDDEQPIGADVEPVQLEASLEEGGQVDLLRLVAEEKVGAGIAMSTRPIVNST